MGKFHLQWQLLASLILGIFCGLFFGDLMRPLEHVGMAFIMLLKMTVLPYMSASIIFALGSLSSADFKRLFAHSMAVFSLFWAVTLFSLFAFGFSFPANLGIPQFGYLLDPPPEVPNLLDLFIPVNPIHAIANDLIPAVVLFSLFFGVAVMQVRSKEPLLQSLEAICKALLNITSVLTKVSPIGVFALVASSTGTLDLEHFQRIQIYLIAYTTCCCFLSFFALPALVACCTGMTQKEFLDILRPALLLGFTTGNNLAALPSLALGLEALTKRAGLEEKSAQSSMATAVPIAYNFPTAGNLMAVLFILFAAAFYGTPLFFFGKLKLGILSIMSLFGAAPATLNAITFLTDKLQIPQDSLALFIQTLPLTRNFQALVSCVGMAAVSFLIAYCGQKKLQWQIKRFVAPLMLLLLLVISLRELLPTISADSSPFAHLHIQSPVPHKILPPAGALSHSEPPLDESLDRIRKEKVARVGFIAGTSPFCYFNDEGELVGFDVAVMHGLARALECSIQFIPLTYSNLVEALERGTCDMAIGAITVEESRLGRIAFSAPYISQERVFICLDHERSRFQDSSQLRLEADLRIATFTRSTLFQQVQEQFPLVTAVPMDSPDQILSKNFADAILWNQAEATMWTLLHPEYGTVVPLPSLGKEHYAYAMNQNSPKLKNFLDYWLEIKMRDGWWKQQQERWILGKRERKMPRWSILRDQFQWVD